MGLVVIIATITAFFSHFLVERAVLANTLSVVSATLITWMLTDLHSGLVEAAMHTQLLLAALIALFISVIVGLVFAYHKKCS